MLRSTSLAAVVLFTLVAVCPSIFVLRTGAQEPAQTEGKEKGEAKKTAVLSGTVRAFESVRVVAQVPGILKEQAVDIGDVVKKGQVLAVLDASVTEAQLREDIAIVRQAQLRVEQAKARLNRLKGIGPAVASDEIEQAKADVANAEASVMVAESRLNKTELQLSHTKIVAPFDGVITKRGFNAGAFIPAADKGNKEPALFTVERRDLMRVIVSIPEREVPFVHVGDAAEVEIPALPGKKWTAKVSRTAMALDPKTSTMAVEIDLPNPAGQIYSGMFATVTINLDRPKE